jgi:hypothetical protein
MFRSFIRISSRPAGDAPEAIRDKWIGLVMPVQKEATEPVGLPGRPKSERRVGYEVRWEDAMRVLGQKHPDAREWWKRNAKGSATLVFEDSCCKVAKDFEL